MFSQHYCLFKSLSTALRLPQGYLFIADVNVFS